MMRRFPRHAFRFLIFLLISVAWETGGRAQEQINVSLPPNLQDKTTALPNAPAAAVGQTSLLFCNTPEKIRTGGAVADAPLTGGTTYTVFYHYRNVSHESGAFVIALHGAETNKPLHFTARQGLADPQHDPPLAGRQAMARFLQAGENTLTGKNGTARFAYILQHGQVASGVLTIRCEKTARLRIYFKHDKWTVPGAGVVCVPDPHKQIAIFLSPNARSQYFRIGIPDVGTDRRLDGTYGMLYAFRVAAPEGRRIRVLFSPRGGKAGMVGSIGGKMTQSPIVGATKWAIFCEATVGKNGVVLTTAPFGGVFYPVELLFQLI